MSDDLIDVLRADVPVLDDMTRARVLADMSPEIDAIAKRHAEPPRRRWWIPAGGFALAAAMAIAWLAARRPAPVVAQPLLRPYVVAGASSDDAATTLLAGRFAALDVGAGQLVRATLGDARGRRVGLVGPAHAAVEGDVLSVSSGTVLVDTDDAVEVHAGTTVIAAQDAEFAAQVVDGTAIVFVDRGEIRVDGRAVAEGQWAGSAGAQSLVTALRDHANAIAPPTDEHAGIAAIRGDAPVVTRTGDIVGTPPVWARMPAGPVVLVSVGSVEQETRVDVQAGATRQVDMAKAPAGRTAAAGTRTDPVATADGPDVANQRPDAKPAAEPDADRGKRPAVALRRPDADHGVANQQPDANRGARSATERSDLNRGHVASQRPDLDRGEVASQRIDANRGTAPAPDGPAEAPRTDGGPRPDVADRGPRIDTADRSPPAEPTAEQLYADAEAALGRSDGARAEALWTDLVRRYPSSAQASSALYDLARLARGRGDFKAAIAYLDRLSSPPAALREPAGYLRCRLDLDAGDTHGAADCFHAFRARFADSPHDAEVLGWLVGATSDPSDCRDYVRRYPRGAQIERARGCAP